MSTSITITGTNGNDKLQGNSNYDRSIINSLNGNDYVTGAKFNPSVNKFKGRNNNITTGTGNDTIYGGFIDVIKTGAGNDLIYTDQTNSIGGDQVDAGAGTDRIFAFNGDVVKGGDGNDIINGGNTFYFGRQYSSIKYSQTDYIKQETGNQLFGDGGNDNITFYGSANLVYGGTGNDTLTAYSYSNTDVVGDEGNDRLTSMYVAGSQGTYLDGGDGNDTLISNNINDVLVGGLGSDTFMVTSTDTFIDDFGAGDTLVINSPLLSGKETKFAKTTGIKSLGSNVAKVNNATEAQKSSKKVLIVERNVFVDPWYNPGGSGKTYDVYLNTNGRGAGFGTNGGEFSITFDSSFGSLSVDQIKII